MGDELEGERELSRDAQAAESGAALGLALQAASRDKADAFLEEQTRTARMQREAGVAEKQARILDLQIQDLEREDVVRHWSLRVRHISDVMKLAFELAVAFIVLAIAFGIGAALWSAARDNSLIIEAFSVPTDMAQRGLTGQAIAAQLQDKLLTMQATTDSARPEASYANNWGNDIKVEIPNTGISISEFYRYLAGWLGQQTHIRGEVYRVGSGIVIAARAGGEGGTKISGSEGDLDNLLQQSAEAIYRQTQPYRYAAFLANHFKNDDARALYEQLVKEGEPRDRLWAQIGLGSLYDFIDPQRGLEHNRKAAALSPTFAVPWQNLSEEDGRFGHDEAALADRKVALRLLERGDPEMSERASRISLSWARATVALALGDFAAALQQFQECTQLPDYSNLVRRSRRVIPQVLALLHQPGEARAALKEIPPPPPGGPRSLFDPTNRLIAYYWMGDWTSVIAMGQIVEAVVKTSNPSSIPSESLKQMLSLRSAWPYVARARAGIGDFKGAHALIDRTPLDCYTCLLNRADIDAVEGNFKGASFWFARAVAAAPSIPMAYFDWGSVLLRKGDLDGAITKFKEAHQKGPHFADPLELWGEVLMLRNRSDLALAKFDEANKYAPRWGRLHLKWGEALWYAGRRDEARAQFQAASTLDLSGSDKAELARARANHG